MAQKEAIKFHNPSQERALSQANFAKSLKFIKKHVASVIDARREALARQVAMNAKVSRALAKEFTRAGLDFKNVEAVCRENSTKNHEQFKASVRQMKKVPKARIPQKISPISGLRSNNVMPYLSPIVTGSATPPFAIFDGSTDPQNIPAGSSGFASANASGVALYSVDTPQFAPAPSNITATAHVGFAETFTPSFLPFSLWPGFAIINMRATLNMMGNASCNIFGNALSEGAVGWIVVEVDDSTGNIRTIYRDFVDEYYIDVSTGGSGAVPVNNPAFSSQITINTLPNRHYVVVLWFFGTIQAEGNAGNQPPWASRAAGFGQMNVESFNWSWWNFIV
jgi:hypothetical protein